MKPARTQLRNVAYDIWNPTTSEFGKHQEYADLLTRVVDRIAEYDVNELLDTSEARVKLWSKLPKIREFRREGELPLLSKTQLLDPEHMPPGMTKRVSAKTQMQVQRYVVRLSLGTV
eukprot:gene2964-1886_t